MKTSFKEFLIESLDMIEASKNASVSFTLKNLPKSSLAVGNCVLYARALQKEIGKGKLVEFKQIKPATDYHTVLLVDGKYYDWLNPEGVTDWKKLKFWDAANKKYGDAKRVYEEPSISEGLIVEDISVVNDTIRITTQHFKAGSTKDSISTFFRSAPYTTKIKGTNAEIFSLLNYVSSDVSSDILKSLKGKGPYKVNETQFNSLLKQIKQHAGIAVKRIKPDFIIYPKSSSPLLKQFVDEIHAAYPHAEVFEEAFIKKMLNAEDVEPLINTDHPDWKKFSTEHPDQVELLKKNLKYQIKHGELELKKFYKPYLKFIKNFIELKNAYEVLEKVMGSSVLVVDDILSSGTTMAEMIRQLEEFEPSKISGLTLFKLTSSAK